MPQSFWYLAFPVKECFWSSPILTESRSWEGFLKFPSLFLSSNKWEKLKFGLAHCFLKLTKWFLEKLPPEFRFLTGDGSHFMYIKDCMEWRPWLLLWFFFPKVKKSKISPYLYLALEVWITDPVTTSHV